MVCGVASYLCRILLLALLCCLPAAAAEAEKFFDPSLGEFPIEATTARKEGKLGILLMFEAEGCPFCRRMRQQVLSRDDVQVYFRRHFATFAVDVLGDQPLTDFSGRETTEKKWARELRVRATPTFIFLDVDGRELARYTGASKDAKEFLQLGRYVVEGHYKQQSFEQYYPDSRPERKKP